MIDLREIEFKKKIKKLTKERNEALLTIERQKAQIEALQAKNTRKKKK